MNKIMLAIVKGIESVSNLLETNPKLRTTGIPVGDSGTFVHLAPNGVMVWVTEDERFLVFLRELGNTEMECGEELEFLKELAIENGLMAFHGNVDTTDQLGDIFVGV